MATEPSSSEIRPRRAKRIPPLPGALVAFIIGWFLGWPIVFFGWIPILKDASEWFYFAIGSGWCLWFLSCVVMGGLVLRVFEQHRSLMVGWFFGWLPLYFYSLTLTGRSVLAVDDDYSIVSFLFYLGFIVWLISCYAIYDLLFKMAQARWPEVKSIRETLDSLIRLFVRSHH